MAKIRTIDAPNINVGPRQVVEGNAQLAGASSERRFDAALNITKYADSLQNLRLTARDNDFYNTTVAKTEVEFNTKLSELQKTRMNNPEGAAEEFREYLSETISERSKGARNISQRTRIEGALTNQMVRYGTNAATWENNRQVAIYQDNLDAAMDAKLELAARTTDKADLDRLYAEATGMVSAAKAGENNPGGFLPQENARVRLDKAKNIYSTGMEALIMTNPARAKQELQAGMWDKELNPVRKAKAIEMVDRRFAANASRDRRIINEKIENLTTYVTRTGDLEGALSGSADPEFSLTAIDQSYGQKLGNKALEKLTDAKGNFDIRKEVFTTPPAQIDQKIQEVTAGLDVFSDDYAQRDEYVRKLTKARSSVYGTDSTMQNSLIAADPVAFVNQAAKFNNAPLQPNDFRGIVAEQRRYGLRDGQIGLLGTAGAAKIASQINGAANTEEKIGIVTSLREQLRMQDSSDEEANKFMQFAMNDLHKVGIDKRLAVVSMMNSIEDVEAQRMGIQVLEMGTEELNKQVSIKMKSRDEGDTPSSLKTAVELELGDFFDSHRARLGNTPGHHAAVRDVAQAVAGGFYLQGDSADRAAERATNFINSRYEYVDQESTAQFFRRGVSAKYTRPAKARFPKEINGQPVDTDGILTYARENLREIVTKQPDALVVPHSYKDDPALFPDYILREGMFVTSNDDDVLELQTPEGARVEIEIDGQKKPVASNIKDAQLWVNKNGGTRLGVVTTREMNVNYINGNLDGLKKMRDNIENEFQRDGQMDQRVFLPEIDARIRELEDRQNRRPYVAPTD